MKEYPEFSLTAISGKRYYVATGIDCDGDAYVYQEGALPQPTHIKLKNMDEAKKLFAASILAICTVEVLG